ncbi:P-type DNA transfer ATPase VirB11 [Escherichia coli]|uniref:P-type DNA transfer ATPase VirB11 n=1 Tax=Escherichia coli TaxID=562 RepID=UPI00285A5301|nr:P-type DNA transfer ATPase VirB11 [Escherichia coli]
MENQHIIYELAQEFFGEYLNGIDGLTEIAVNRPDEVFLKVRGKWLQKEQKLSYGDCESFAAALADFNHDSLSVTKPVLSATLPTGERVQVVLPPATEQGTISITIRKPSNIFISHDDFVAQGFYEKINTQTEKRVDPDKERLLDLYNSNRIDEFVVECLRQGKTMAFSGGTGSGKTTFSNAILEYIPHYLRIICIQDTPETKYRKHKNYVNLFYPSEGGDKSIITPAMLLRACFRMNPDRILMTEIRGGEAWDFLKGISSGHSGGITTVHENSPEAAISGIVERCAQNPECHNIPYNVLLRKALNNIDVVISINYLDQFDKRYATGIYFKDLHRDSYYEALRG